MPDRTINFGESETEATYQIQDTDAVDGGGNFVVAKDTNADTVLLEYDPATDTWQYAGDVDMNGGNVSGVGTLTADSVSTKQATIENSGGSRTESLIGRISDDVSTSSPESIPVPETYRQIRIEFSTVIAQGDDAFIGLRLNGIDTADYTNDVVNSGGINATTETEWRLVESNGGNGVIGGRYVINLSRYPSISGTSATAAANDSLLRGTLSNSISLSSIDVVAIGNDIAFGTETEFGLTAVGIQ